MYVALEEKAFNGKWWFRFWLFAKKFFLGGNGPKTVWESPVSNTELSELLALDEFRKKDLDEFLSAYYLCAKANSEFFTELTDSELSEFSLLKQYSENSILADP